MSVIDKSKRECPLCGERVKDFLKHVRIKHDIGSAEEMESKKLEFENKKTKQAKFAAYVEELKQRKVSPEEYRELITKWQKENE